MQLEWESRPTSTVGHVLATSLERWGCVAAFGVLGGSIAPFARSLTATRIPLIHMRHEGAAGLAAVEASIASGRPAVVFATTGPGLTNSVTGMVACRSEGGAVVFVSGATPRDRVGRFAFQETSERSGLDGLGRDLVSLHAVLHGADDLAPVLARLERGLARPEGFVAHIVLPLSVQGALASPSREAALLPTSSRVEESDLERARERLSRGRFVIWTGFGARHASAAVRELAERTSSPVMASPRAKGIFPEDHPLYLGVTGLGGHDVAERLRHYRPDHVLVLGTRMGEMTSFWDARLVPPGGIVQVDVDPDAFGRAYPDAPTLAIRGDAARVAAALATRMPPAEARLVCGVPPLARLEPMASGPVRPSALMAAIQRVIVERSHATVLTEAGNAFAWTTHVLRFREAGRYRVSTGFGSMGMATAGVVGVAAATRAKAVAVVGDGAMLMHQEVSTAVQERLPAVWIVLNDACYGMIEQGMRALGWAPFAVEIPRVDFVALARAVGADGARVEREQDLDAALEAALRAERPFVVDVITDPAEAAPTGARNQSLSRGFGGR